MPYFESESVEFFSSGSQILDCVLGGGWASGRIINVVGNSSSGKSLLSLEACANHLMRYPDGTITYCDLERAFDESYISNLGIDLDTLGLKYGIYTVEDLSNHLFESLEKLNPKQHHLWVVDSLDALSDEAEKGRPIDDPTYGGTKAKKMSELFRRLNQDIAKKNLTLFIVSQTRDMLNSTFPMKTRSGGQALQFYCSQVVWLHEHGKLEKTINKVKRVTGLKVKAKCTKNKVGMPFRECDIEIIIGRGTDDVTSNLNFLSSVDQLNKLPKIDGTAPDNITTYVSKIWKSSPEELDTYRTTIANLTRETWAEIEKGFVPTMPIKYVKKESKPIT